MIKTCKNWYRLSVDALVYLQPWKMNSFFTRGEVGVLEWRGFNKKQTKEDIHWPDLIAKLAVTFL